MFEIIPQLSMNRDNLNQTEKEIIEQIGYFPAFLIPAVDCESIDSSLVKQTLSSYIDNPLPVRFKEKLAILLSFYFGISYFTICHSCTLHSLGVPPQDILALGKIEFPQTEKLAVAQLKSLDDRLWQEWQNNSQIEAILLRCSGFIFLNSKASSDLCNQLKSYLGEVYYYCLIILLGYIKLCHKWVIDNPISHQQDYRSQMYLGSLLLKEIELAKFFQLEKRHSLHNDFSQKSQGSLAIKKDGTDIIDYETKLAEAESKLELVAQATKTGYYSWDLTTNKVEICCRGRSILGLENFDGRYISFLQSVQLNERESVDLEIARAIQAHQNFDLKYRLIKFDRETTLIRNFGKLKYNAKGQPVSVSGIVTDITSNRTDRVDLDLDRYRLRKQLPTNNYLLKLDTLNSIEFQTIFDLLPYYIFVVDLKTQTISSMNLNMAQSLSVEDAQAARGKTIAECFAPEYVELIAEQHQQVTTAKQVLRVRQKMTLADGIHYFETAIVPLVDKNGSVYALLHTYNDLRDLADTEEALSQRTIQLEAANRELESFSYSVSHDLQAPLRIINGFSQVLWEQYESDLDSRGKHYIERIQANSRRMSDLIDALLQLSRVTRSQMRLIDVNLSAIALNIVEELRLSNPERQVEITIAPNLRTQGDPQLLRIALSNLFNNAWKYTSKRSQAEIEFGSLSNVQQPQTYYLRDNGAGFDIQYADKLFTAFQRLHTEEEFPGTGIGLATVQRIIYRHGGRVWAQGECDRGATIYFSL